MKFPWLYLFFGASQVSLHLRSCHFWVSHLLPSGKNIAHRGWLCPQIRFHGHTWTFSALHQKLLQLPAHFAILPFELSPVTTSAFAHMLTLENLIMQTCRGKNVKFVEGQIQLHLYSYSYIYLSHNFAFFGHHSFHVILLIVFKSIPPSHTWRISQLPFQLLSTGFPYNFNLPLWTQKLAERH